MPTSSTRVRPLARATRAASLAAALSAAACSPDAALRPVDSTPSSSPSFVVTIAANAGNVTAPTALDFATYDGSREVVHPDVVDLADWHGHRLWTVLTPYPNSAWQVENPSLYVSETGDSWNAPSGVANPLAKPAGPGYLSDPDVVFDGARDQLFVYYRNVVMKSGKHQADNVYLITSGDGTRWSAPRMVASDRGRYLVSPTVVRRSAADWRMWAVDAGTAGCSAKDSKVMMRRSTDGVRWSATAPVQLAQPGYVPWHMDVEYSAERNEYWALVAAFPKGEGCTSTSLFLATSPDGERWTTYPSPILARGVVPQFATNVYRSSLLFGTDGSLTLWMSGARTVGAAGKKGAPTLKWSAAVARTTAAGLLARVQQPSTAKAAARLTGPRLLGAVESSNDVP